MYPLAYTEPVFRPPSEWKSLILQVTNGCSWNRCTFCDMYTSETKKFRPKKIELIEEEIQKVKASGLPVQRVFLADGDAMMLPFNRLKEILTLIREYFGNVRVSSYCLPRNLKNKTITQLAELKELGLKIMYVGCESGDDKVLELVAKGETYLSSLEALQKIKSAGLKSSVMILIRSFLRLSGKHSLTSPGLKCSIPLKRCQRLMITSWNGDLLMRKGS